jgi:aminoglycoside phosphotransferase family enzyme/predicted kinase
MPNLAQDLPPLILALTNPAVYPHPVKTIEIMQTHISWIILTGQFAYKIKKPVHFNFLDYSTLDKRYDYCQEELKLNRACAAPLYKAVLPLYGNISNPSFTSNGKPPIEYAVQMQEFPQEALLAAVLSHLNSSEQIHLIDKIGHYLADFHAECPHAPNNSPYGEPLHGVYQPISDNIKDIKKLSTHLKITQLNNSISEWIEPKFLALTEALAKRKAKGFIRQCHGDLHLGNMVYLNNHVYCFDRIEFNSDLSWIDVMSDLAFLLMDLEFHNAKHLSYRLLNTYIDHSGDYAGIHLLSMYKAYRAMVRAKIALLTTPKNDKEALAYLVYTNQLIQDLKPKLILTHGFSGSGKSYLSTALAPYLNCILLRSDIYRKHKRTYNPKEKSKRYTQQNINAVYDDLFALTEGLLKEGQSVWVDATFLKNTNREKFTTLAKKLGISFVILDIQAPYSLLADRLSKRPPSEAGISVLEKQITTHDPLTPNEQPHVVIVPMRGDTAISQEILINQIQQALS